MEAVKVGAKRSWTASAVERKEVERRRRNDMKFLCLKLGSLVPKEHRSKDAMTQLGSLDDAAAYIKKLKERVDEMQQKRSSRPTRTTTTTTMASGGSAELLEEEPVVEVRYDDESSLMDVVLVCSSARRPFRLHEVIAVLDEEGVEVINASHSVAAAGQKVFCSIHARALSSRIGVEVARVSERLGALIK